MISQYLREKSVSLLSSLQPFEGVASKASFLLYCDLTTLRKQAVKQSTFPLTMSTSAERTDKEQKKKRTQKQIKSIKIKVPPRRKNGDMEKKVTTQICGDKQEALEGNWKAYKQTVKVSKKVKKWSSCASARACRIAVLYIYALACKLLCSGLFIINFILCHLASYCCEVLLNSKKHAKQDNL